MGQIKRIDSGCTQEARRRQRSLYGNDEGRKDAVLFPILRDSLH